MLTGTQRCAKRALDVVGALGIIIVATPAIALVAMCIRVVLGRPILFKQQRAGLRGRAFCLYKFRTMRDERDEQGVLLPDSVRMGKLGHFLRATSLDELPQLVNVLRGEMSLVGPRPLLLAYLSRYSTAQLRRHDVKPGITGWAQVRGRNALTWDEKFTYDVWYTRHWSLWLDLRIVLLTFGRVVSGAGVKHQGHATMPEFMGTDVQRDDDARSGVG